MWWGKLRSGQRWGLYFRWEIFTVTALKVLWKHQLPVSNQHPVSSKYKRQGRLRGRCHHVWDMSDVCVCDCICMWLHTVQYIYVYVCVSIKSRFLCLCLWIFVCVHECVGESMCVCVCEYACVCIWKCLCFCVCDSELGSHKVHLLKHSCDVLVLEHFHFGRPLGFSLHFRKKYFTFYFTTFIWYL